jgi:hypothetical protein
MQITTPAMETPVSPSIIEKIREDVARWAAGARNPGWDGTFEVVEDTRGTGLHVHDAACRDNCMRYCDNSDRIVTVLWHACGWQADYGVLHGEVTLWAN